MDKKTLRGIGFSGFILLAALTLLGSFHEFISCALSCAMGIWLLLRLRRQKQLVIRRDMLTSAVVALCLGYGLTCFWAVDRGMAWIGFLKFLPLLLYLLCLEQEAAPEAVLPLLPWLGGLMTVVSAIGMQFPALESLFSVAGRLAGFFQYPNTFAVFLLVCILLLMEKRGKSLWEFLLLGVLAFGLLYTGSRTAFVVAALAICAMALYLQKNRLRAFLILAGGLAALLLLALVLDNTVLDRYLTISLKESTFVGRLLYWSDALPLLLRYPFGMGFYGYQYIQQSVQTGVYSVLYAHNDFLQLLLDVGFLPAGLLFVAMIRWFAGKTVPASRKILVGALCLHSFFDFDLQFVGIFLLLLLLLRTDAAPRTLNQKPTLPLRAGLGVAVVASLYLCAALLCAFLGANTLSETLYPYNTRNKLTILEKETDPQAVEALCDDILKQNSVCYVPYSLKAQLSFTRGDIPGMMEYYRAALARSPFAHTEYEYYCRMLMQSIQLYQQRGDTKSAMICKQELLAVAKQLSANGDRLSPLGKLIADQPVTTLPQDILQFIQQLGG